MSEAALGIHTKYVSARRKKYELQAVSARLLPGERVEWCGKRASGAVVEIRKSGEECFFHGLQRCGSVWLCPVCASRISEVRRGELLKAAGSGHSMLLVTLTLQHSREDKLSELLEALNTAWRKTRGGRAWQRLEAKYGIVASVSALEITYGLESGFHPHKHVLLWSSLPESELNVAEFEAALSARWRAVLAKLNKYGSEFWSVKVSLGERPVAGYLAKWGVIEEVTKFQSKKANGEHYSMWQVLELAGSGEAWAVRAFREYAHATRGRRWLFWSRGARALFGLGEEQSEQEVAESEPAEHETVSTLTLSEWRRVCRCEKREELLEIAEASGAPGVRQFLDYLLERGET